MTGNVKTFLTPEGLKKLERELTELKTVKRKEIAERINDAKELGDLSENAEYSDAKTEQAFIEGRIQELENVLKYAEIIEKPPHTNSVEIGSTINVYDDKKHKSKFIIVGSNESEPAQGIISNESPLGKAFLGKKVGDVVAIPVPSGMTRYVISEIH